VLAAIVNVEVLQEGGCFGGASSAALTKKVFEDSNLGGTRRGSVLPQHELLTFSVQTKI
jgi:hypothetical protein